MSLEILGKTVPTGDEGYLIDPANRGSAGRNDLFKLFPYSYVKQACKIAGMRKPRAWSTG